MCFLSLAAYSQHLAKTDPSLAKYLGKYQTGGMVVQVASYKDSLVLVVPGAPLQQLIWVRQNEFRSGSFDEASFIFVEEGGKVTRMISSMPSGSIELQRMSDTPGSLNAVDSLLSLNKSTEHFQFLYTPADSSTITYIAEHLERNYARILRDFNLKTIPITEVRVYPDRTSFHSGINFPGASDFLLATAFGKSDFRMLSPRVVGENDSAMLMKMVTHEFTHCVHLNVDYSPNNPRWLWEGVANYEAGWFVDPNDIEIIRKKIFPPFSSLNNGLEYEVGYVIVEAVKEIWSFNKVIQLISNRGDTEKTLQIQQDAFEKRIYDHIFKKYIKE
jgi:hypothetical protein